MHLSGGFSFGDLEIMVNYAFDALVLRYALVDSSIGLCRRLQGLGGCWSPRLSLVLPGLLSEILRFLTRTCWQPIVHLCCRHYGCCWLMRTPAGGSMPSLLALLHIVNSILDVFSFYWTTLLCGPVYILLLLQLSAMDVLARTPMKGAAKCDEHCELQNSVNQ